MESNTFATSQYIATSQDAAFEYLRDLRNLDEWTLYSRMIEQVDENTWRGTASGYQHDLFYHVRPIETPLFNGALECRLFRFDLIAGSVKARPATPEGDA